MSRRDRIRVVRRSWTQARHGYLAAASSDRVVSDFWWSVMDACEAELVRLGVFAGVGS